MANGGIIRYMYKVRGLTIMNEKKGRELVCFNFLNYYSNEKVSSCVLEVEGVKVVMEDPYLKVRGRFS